MPEFGSSFTGLAHKRKFTKSEIVRAIRFVVASGYAASQVYSQLATSINNHLVEKVFKSVADEECIHIRKFLRLFQENIPDGKKFLAKGAKEVEEVIEDLKQKKCGTNVIQTLSMKGLVSCARFPIVDCEL
jgi:rubrerythrin